MGIVKRGVNAALDDAADKAQSDAWTERQKTLDGDREEAVNAALDDAADKAQSDAWTERQKTLDGDREEAVNAALDDAADKAQTDAWTERQKTLDGDRIIAENQAVDDKLSSLKDTAWQAKLEQRNQEKVFIDQLQADLAEDVNDQWSKFVESLGDENGRDGALEFVENAAVFVGKNTSPHNVIYVDDESFGIDNVAPNSRLTINLLASSLPSVAGKLKLEFDGRVDNKETFEIIDANIDGLLGEPELFNIKSTLQAEENPNEAFTQVYTVEFHDTGFNPLEAKPEESQLIQLTVENVPAEVVDVQTSN